MSSKILSIFWFLGQYNLTGSLEAAILGMEFSWTCSMTIPPGQTHDAVIFRRNLESLGMLIRFPNGTCASFDTQPRYNYRCDTDHVFSLIIPADNMTEYENNSVWQCEYFGDGRYRSLDQLLKIAGMKTLLLKRTPICGQFQFLFQIETQRFIGPSSY